MLIPFREQICGVTDEIGVARSRVKPRPSAGSSPHRHLFSCLQKCLISWDVVIILFHEDLSRGEHREEPLKIEQYRTQRGACSVPSC